MESHFASPHSDNEHHRKIHKNFDDVFKNNSKGVNSEDVFPIFSICTQDCGQNSGNPGPQIPCLKYGKSSYFRPETLHPKFLGQNREKFPFEARNSVPQVHEGDLGSIADRRTKIPHTKGQLTFHAAVLGRRAARVCTATQKILHNTAKIPLAPAKI